ncbi:MAG TPA: FkbM family methyltransferase [Caldilineaceae bacterium]|nr:FkbM family methyltransferase [Caldilineaceae bacterium]
MNPTPNPPAVRRDLRRSLGLLRSLLIYYAKPFQIRRMVRFYAQLIRPGDLCFDIGAHVGNRLNAWSRLGTRIVAVEPQPQCMALLRRLYGRAPNIVLVEQAVGAAPGAQTLLVSESNPTVSTLSAEWIAAVRRVDSFAAVRWESAVQVSVTTLDDLIARYGEPAFCKIDIEGYELEALRGLSRPLRTLCFEYIPAAQEIALGCIERLAALGDYRYNWSVGEQHRWASPSWLDAGAMSRRLAQMPLDGPSGDIYARRMTPSIATSSIAIAERELP